MNKGLLFFSYFCFFSVTSKGTTQRMASWIRLTKRRVSTFSSTAFKDAAFSLEQASLWLHLGKGRTFHTLIAESNLFGEMTVKGKPFYLSSVINLLLVLINTIYHCWTSINRESERALTSLLRCSDVCKPSFQILVVLSGAFPSKADDVRTLGCMGMSFASRFHFHYELKSKQPKNFPDH